MTSVDKRIVQMDFDNKSFEKGVNQTIKDLETLEKKMQFSDAGKGFSKLEAMANNVNLDGIKNEIESINDKFSVMGVVAFNVISRITNAAMDMFGKLSSMTIGQAISGGSTRALNLEQAMFQFKGLGMDVEATMADVNYAVDGTAYSLDDAAKVAAMLGASGMRAGADMQNALRGISGVAAMAGTSYSDVGNIFTKVAGQGRLMGDDLLSLASRGVNAAAILAGQWGKTEAEVRDMVTKGKVSFAQFSDAMNQAFGEHATKANETFTGAMSNVESALSRIGAKFFTPFYNNARDVLNALRPVINKFSTALDPAFKVISDGMAKLSTFIQGILGKIDFTAFAKGVQELSDAFAWVFKIGDTSAIEENLKNGIPLAAEALKIAESIKMVVTGLKNVFTSFWNVLKPVGQAFQEVFPMNAVDIITNITRSFRNLTQQFKIGEDSTKGIKDAMVTFFTAVKTVGSYIGTTLSGAFTILKPILSIVGKLFGYLGSVIGGFIGLMSDADSTTDGFASVVENVSTKIADLISKLGSFLPSVESFNKAVQKVRDVLSDIGNVISTNIASAFQKLGEFLQPVIEWLGKAKDAAAEFINNIDFNKVFLGLGAFGAGGVTLGIVEFVRNLKNVVPDLAGFVDSLKAPLDSLADVLDGFANQLNSKALQNVAIAIGVLAISLLILSTIDPVGLVSGVAAMALLMGELVGFVKLMDMINPVGLSKVSAGLILMSFGLLLMSAAMKNLSSLSWSEIIKGGVALGILSGILIGLTAAMNAIKSQAIGGAFSMIIIGAALLVLAQALRSLGTIETGVLIQGFVAMTAALLVLTIALNFMKSAVGGAVAMVIVSAALIVLAQALGILGAMPMEQLVQGMIAVAAMLTILVVALNFMKSAMGAAIAMVIIASALMILTNVLSILGSMDLMTLVQGMIAFTLMLIAFVAVALLLAPVAGQVLLVSVSLLIFATGLLVAAAAIVVMAIGLNMLMAAGFPALGMLALLGLALIPIVAISPLLLLAGAGFLLLGVGLLAVGAGLLLFSIAGAGAIPLLFLLGVAMIPLSVMAPFMIVVGAAFLVLGAASLVLGAGLMVLSMGFTMMNASLPMAVEGLMQLAQTAVAIAPASALFIALGAELLILGAGAAVAGAGLMILAVAMILLAAALAIMAAIGTAGADALKYFGDYALDFVAASVVLLGAVPGWLAAGAALLVLGAGALVAGAGIVLIGAGLVTFSAGLMLFNAAWPTAVPGMTAIVEAMSGVTSIAPLIALIGMSLSAMGQGITQIATSAETASAGLMVFSEGIVAFQASVDNNTAAVIASLTTLVQGIATNVTALMPYAAQMIILGTSFTIFGNGVKVAATSSMLLGIGLALAASSLTSINTSMLMFNMLYPIMIQGFVLIASTIPMLTPIIPILMQVGAALFIFSVAMASYGAAVTTAAVMTILLVSGLSNVGSTASKSSSLVSASMALIVSSVSSSTSLVVAMLNLMANGIATSMTMSASRLLAGTNQMNAAMLMFIAQISANVSQVRQQFQQVGPAVNDGLSSAATIAYYAGRNVVQGCIDGMGSMMSSVYNMGHRIGAKAVEGVNAGADNRSPSHETYKSGTNIVQGGINGMLSLLGAMYSAGKTVGQNAVTGISDGMSKATNLFSDVDVNPVITPVVDLSNLSKIDEEIARMNQNIATTKIDYASLSDPSKPVGDNYIINLDGWTINDLNAMSDVTIGTLINMVKKGRQ